MKVYEIVGLEDKLGFGKHRQSKVAEVLELDPEYLLWLRNDRWKQNQGVPSAAGFSDEVHQLLDIYLEANPKLITRNGYRYRFAGPEKIELPPEKPSEELARSEDWGAW